MIIDGIKRAALAHPSASLGGATLIGGVAAVGGGPVLLGSALVGVAVAATAKVMNAMRDSIFQDRVTFLERSSLAAGIDPNDLPVTVGAGMFGDQQFTAPLSTLIDAKNLSAAGHGSGFANNARFNIPESEALRVIESIKEHQQQLAKDIAANEIKVVSSGWYVGRIATINDGIAVQRVSPTAFVGHAIDKLSEIPQNGALLDIQYQRDTGRGMVTDVNERKAERGLGR